MPLELRIEEPAWSAAIKRIDEHVDRAAYAALEAAEFSPKRCSISVLLCSDQEMMRLNEQFRGRAAATNVLSWPSMALDKPLTGERDLLFHGQTAEDELFLGDIALGFGVVQREAESTFKSLEAHLSHLIVHGVLHLLGYDHEDEAEAEAMAAREVAALSTIGVADPYE